jgi:hypothetical protein
MKHLAIFLLAFFIIFALGMLATRPKPLIVEACSPGQWEFNNAGAPRNWPKEHRMYAPCPWTPWALPKKQDEVQA